MARAMKTAENEVGKRVQYKHRVRAKARRKQPAQRCADRQHRRPGGRAERISREQFVRGGDVGHRGGLGRLEDRPNRHLQGDEGVEQR